MFVKDIVTIDIPALNQNTLICDAKSLFCKHKVSDLAVVNETMEFIGILEEESLSIINEDLQSKTINECELLKISVNTNQHIYEIFETLASHSLSLIPIVNDKNKYTGVITINNLISYISTLTSFKQKGAVIIITIQQNEYSLSHICSIVESNGAKIISLFTNFVNDSTIEITIKVNIEEITSIMQSFDRYNYQTKTLYAQTEVLDVLLQSRIENLMNYLNV